MEQTPSIMQSVEPQDRIQPTKTLYEASAFEIFFKNFLAGFGRAIGGIFIYVIFLLISINLFITYAYPQIKPFIDEYRQAVQAVNALNKSNATATKDMQQYMQFVSDLQDSLPGNNQ